MLLSLLGLLLKLSGRCSVSVMFMSVSMSVSISVSDLYVFVFLSVFAPVSVCVFSGRYIYPCPLLAL